MSEEYEEHIDDVTRRCHSKPFLDPRTRALRSLIIKTQKRVVAIDNKSNKRNHRMVTSEAMMSDRFTQDDDLSSLFSDDDSIGSIFSSDEEEELMPITNELGNEFQARDELLDQLLTEIDPRHALLIRKIEVAVRKQKIHGLKQLQVKLLEDKTARTSLSSHSSSDTNSNEENRTTSTSISTRSSSTFKSTEVMVKDNQIGWMNRMKQKFGTGMRFRLEGLAILVLNCIAYNGGTYGRLMLYSRDWHSNISFPLVSRRTDHSVTCSHLFRRQGRV